MIVLEQFTSVKRCSVLCFSHLRWNFVYQRPQHLLSRCQKMCDVHFWEEPVYRSLETPELQIVTDASGLRVVTPQLPEAVERAVAFNLEQKLLDEYLKREKITEFISWYYTPMALAFSSQLSPRVVVYDCMDELSAFQGAPPELIGMEDRLFARADIVFTGGASLHEEKRMQHRNVHLFPSSIDREHFAAARLPLKDPVDQSGIAHPRVGYYGVLDERLDQLLLREVAEHNSDIHLVLVGPIAKIDPNLLPKAPNIHYLGQKSYQELPQYVGNWDVAMLPFAQNASTRFISPTKTPEYLAAGKPVVSTPIRDVVRPYGELGLVEIAGDAQAFSEAIRACLDRKDDQWRSRVDQFIGEMSWDRTFERMWNEIGRCMQANSMPGDSDVCLRRGESYV
ncbi:glycosyltransferase family 1 protein [Occallatibacter savannae]|uniref:glycosyltransferase family 1 protein n=1 Tax=Occallatibacter savannae TaxID=1002691 RepID=UPI000D69808C|nr:glycosyltransferase family 1 protein [Occallatibacter savannae]